MAQMGCFVPADFASFRLADKVWRGKREAHARALLDRSVIAVDVRSSCASTNVMYACQLFTRLSLDDRIEANASSFLLEVHARQAVFFFFFFFFFASWGGRT